MLDAVSVIAPEAATIDPKEAVALLRFSLYCSVKSTASFTLEVEEARSLAVDDIVL